MVQKTKFSLVISYFKAEKQVLGIMMELSFLRQILFS